MFKPRCAMTDSTLEQAKGEALLGATGHGDAFAQDKRPGTVSPRGSLRALLSADASCNASSADLCTDLSVSGSVRRPIPAAVSPSLATLADAPPAGDEWIHEVKLDGYRLICRVVDSQVQFLTRNNLDWSGRFPALAAAIRQLPAEQVILDGEVVVMDEAGTSSFQRLQDVFHGSDDSAVSYCAFDLLYVNGMDLQPAPIERRRRVLEALVRAAQQHQIRFSEHTIGHGPEFFQKCAASGFEGIVSKRLGSPYVQTRTMDWIKTKCSLRDEFVIAGFTDSAETRREFEALLLGRYDDDGILHYAGRVERGFSDSMQRDVAKLLSPLRIRGSPFQDGPESGLPGVHFVRPQIVGQIQFVEWTADGLLQQATFQGLREDLLPRQVKSHAPEHLADPERQPGHPHDCQDTELSRR